MLEAAADRSYLESAIQVAGAYELCGRSRVDTANACDARVLGRDWTARHARRTWRQGKCLATIGDSFRLETECELLRLSSARES